MHEMPVFGQMVGLSAVVQQLGFEERHYRLDRLTFTSTLDLHYVRYGETTNEQVNTIAVFSQKLSCRGEGDVFRRGSELRSTRRVTDIHQRDDTWISAIRRRDKT